MTRILLRDLSPATSYRLQLRAVNSGDVSDWSTMLSFDTNQDNIAPQVPSGLTVEVAGSSFVAKWLANSTTNPLNYDLDHYEVRFTRNTTRTVISVPPGDSPKQEFTLEANRNVFGATTPAATVVVDVRSVDRTGNASAWSSTVSATNPAPGPVTGLTITPGVEQITLTWTAPSDIDLVGFNIYASGSATPGTLIGNINSNKFIHNVSSGTWYYNVRAVDVFGQESTYTISAGYSPKNAQIVDLLAPKPPTSVTVNPAFDDNRQQGTVDVSWTPPTQNTDNSTLNDLAGYQIRYSTSTSSWNSTNAGRDETSTKLDVTAGQSYYVQVRAFDFNNNYSSWQSASVKTGGGTAYPVAIPADTSKPSTPATPTAASNTMQIQVTHNNKRSDNTTDMESDVAYYDVYAKPTNDTGWVYNSTTYLGKLTKSTVTSQTFYIPNAGVINSGATVPQNWFVRVFAVDRSGNRSDNPSSSVQASPTLIGTLNVADATITDAKITELKANKITAGTGIIADLTIGNSSTPGSLASYAYRQNNNNGYLLTDSGLTINDGLIRARALDLQNGSNIVPPVYSDFEARPSSYNSLFTLGSSVLLNPYGYFGNQSLSWTTSGSTPSVYLGTSLSDFNINVEGGKTYIVSWYAKIASGGTSVDMSIRMRFNNSTANNPTYRTIGTSWARYSSTFTAPSDATKALAFLYNVSGGFVIDVDGIQVEEKTGSTDTPSPWGPSSSTVITGGQILTGQIQSNTSAVIGGVTLPLWYIDFAGGAQFTSAKVLGDLVIGGANSAGSGSVTSSAANARSQNYSPGSMGWIIDATGKAEFQDATIRGSIIATSGSITGSLNLLSPGRLYAGTSPNDLSLGASGIIGNTSQPILIGSQGTRRRFEDVDYIQMEDRLVAVSTRKNTLLPASARSQLILSNPGKDFANEYDTTPLLQTSFQEAEDSVGVATIGNDIYTASNQSDGISGVLRRWNAGLQENTSGSFPIYLSNGARDIYADKTASALWVVTETQVRRYSSGGTFMQQVTPAISPRRIAADSTRDNVFVLAAPDASTTYTLYIYSSSLSLKQTVSVGNYSAISKMTIRASDGAVMFTSYSGQIFTYSANGVSLGSRWVDIVRDRFYALCSVNNDEVLAYNNATNSLDYINLAGGESLRVTTAGYLTSQKATLKGTTAIDRVKTTNIFSGGYLGIVAQNAVVKADSFDVPVAIAKASRNTNQTVTTGGSVQPLNPTTIEIITNNSWTKSGSSPFAWTCNDAGWWRITAWITWESNTNGRRKLTLHNDDGAEVVVSNDGLPGGPYPYGQQVVYTGRFREGQAIYAAGYHTAGSTISVTSQWITFEKVGI